MPTRPSHSRMHLAVNSLPLSLRMCCGTPLWTNRLLSRSRTSSLVSLLVTSIARHSQRPTVGSSAPAALPRSSVPRGPANRPYDSLRQPPPAGKGRDSVDRELGDHLRPLLPLPREHRKNTLLLRGPERGTDGCNPLARAREGGRPGTTSTGRPTQHGWAFLRPAPNSRLFSPRH